MNWIKITPETELPEKSVILFKDCRVLTFVEAEPFKGICLDNSKRLLEIDNVGIMSSQTSPTIV